MLENSVVTALFPNFDPRKSTLMKIQKRVVIDSVSPQINNGEFPIKRIVNEVVIVDAHVLADGHDVIAASVLYKHSSARKWQEVRMQHLQNDEWPNDE